MSATFRCQPQPPESARKKNCSPLNWQLQLAQQSTEVPAEVVQQVTEALLERLNKLGDAISHVEARLFVPIQCLVEKKVSACINFLEEKVTFLQQAMTKTAPSLVEFVFLQPAVYLLPYLPETQMTTPGSATSLPHSESPQMFSLTALQGVSNAVGGFHVPRDILDAVIQSCR